jgi:hypothetical protein
MELEARSKREREWEMPEYLSMEAYSSCSEENLSTFFGKVRRLLEEMEYASKDVETWLAQITWEPDGSGFSISFPPLLSLKESNLLVPPAGMYSPGTSSKTRPT